MNRLSPRAIELATLLLLFPLLLGCVFWWTPVNSNNDGFDSDGRFYGAMAGEASIPPAYAHSAPYCWRVLSPYLASRLPWDVLVDFRVLSFLSCWASLVLLYGILRRGYDLSRPAALTGVLLYVGVFWTVRFSFYSPAYIDSETQALTLLVLYATIRKRFWIVPFLMVPAVLQKETALALAFVVYAQYGKTHGWWRPRGLSYLGLGLLLPSLLALASVRSAVVPINEYSWRVVLLYLSLMTTIDAWLRLAQATFSGLGILAALVLCFPKRVLLFSRREPLWAVLALFGLLFLFGGNDKSRLFLYMLPAVVVAATWALAEIVDGRSVRGTVWLGLTFGVHLYFGNFFHSLSSFTLYLSRMVPVHAPETTYRPYLIVNGAVLACWLCVTALLLWRLPRPQVR